MRLAEIQASLYDLLGFNTTPDSAITRRMNRYINMSHREILGMRGMKRLRREILTFSSSAGIAYSSLPQAAVRVDVIVDSTNQRPLGDISLADMRYRDPARVSTGTPDAYTILSYRHPLNVELTAAAQPFIVSDTAGDGSGVSVSIEGTITGGYYRKASIAMNGLTPVAIDTLATWEHIAKFYLSAPATGNVTLTQGSGGAELARITQGRTSARYTRLQWTPIPSAAITYYADVELHVEDMLAPNDEPLLPEDFHWLLESGALKREWVKREKAQMWKIEDLRYREGVAALKAWIGQQGGVGTAGQRKSSSAGGFSQLGPAFQAGS